MALTERLALLIDAKADGAVRDIRTLAKEAGKTDDASKKLEARGHAIGTAFKVGAGVLAGAALVKLAQLSGEAVDAAASLGEQQSKTNVVFGDAADKVREFGESAAESLNLSEREALSAASTFGQFFDAAGMATDAGADMSMVMVKLAADMASFQDADPSEVLENLRSGLSGESEPLRKFGVFLNETAVAAKAAELGLQGVNGKLTDGEKIQARYAIIMEQTVKQQGDLARTSESLSNKQRQATAMAEDAKAALGEGLLPAQLALTNAFIEATPAITAVANGVANAVEAFTDLPGPIQAVVAGAAAAGGGFLVLSPRIKAARDVLREFSDESPRAARGMRGLGTAAAGLTIMAVAGEGIKKLEEASRDSVPSVEALTSSLLDLGNAGTAARLSKDLGDVGDALKRIDDAGLRAGVFDKMHEGGRQLSAVASAAESVAGVFGSDLALSLQEAKEQVTQLDAAMANIVGSGSAEQAGQVFAKLATSYGLSADEQKRLMDLMPQYKEALAGQENQARLAAGATGDLGTATGGLVPPTEEAIKAQEKLAEAQAKLRGEARGTAQSFVALGDSASDAEVSLNSWIEDMQKQSQALRNFTANARTAADKGLRQGLIAALQEMGPAGAMRLQQLANASKTEIGKANAAWRGGQDAMREYVKFKVPPKKITVDAAGALATIGSLQEKLNNLPREKRIRIISQVFGGTGTNPVPPGVRAPKSTPRASSTPDDIRGLGGFGGSGRLAGRGVSSLDAVMRKDAESTKAHTKDVDENRSRVREHTQALREAKASFKADVADSFNEEIFNKGGLAGAMAQLQTNATSATAMQAALEQAKKLGLKGGAFQALATSEDLQTAQEMDTREEVAAFMALFNASKAAGKSLGNFAGDAAFGKKLEQAADKQSKSNDRLSVVMNRLPGEMRVAVRQGMNDNDRALRAKV